MATWSERCPLAGTCSECGLEFAWGDVFVPPRLAGLVEHARGVREWAWDGVRTFFGVWRPRRFWTWLKLEHPLRLGLARAWLFCACVVGVIAVPLLWRILRFRIVRSTGSVQGDLKAELDWWIGCEWLTRLLPGDLGQRLFYRWNGYGWSGQWIDGLDSGWYRNTSVQAWWALPLMVMCSISPAVFVLTPWTRARAKVRLGHVARWWVYGQSWLVLLFCWQVAIVVLGMVQWWLSAPFVPGMTAVPAATGSSSGLSNLMRVSLWSYWIEKVPAPMESKLVVPGVWVLWLMWWNWCALRTGMRLTPGTVIRVWMLLMAVTVLVGIAVVLAQEVWFGIVIPREF